MNEDLAVTDLAGVGRLAQNLDDLFGHSVIHGYFQAYLRQEVHDILCTTVQFCVAFLAAEAFHFGYGDPLDANTGQGFPDVIQLEWLNNSCDHFHFVILTQCLKTGIIAFACDEYKLVNPKKRFPAGPCEAPNSSQYKRKNTMLNNELLNDLSARITRLLPLATEVREEAEKNIHRALQSAFSRLNLVTREEFDAQMKVLERAEQTISELEAKIAALEKAVKVTPTGNQESAG